MKINLEFEVNDNEVFETINLLTIDGEFVHSFRVHPNDAEKIIELIEWNQEYITYGTDEH